MSRLICHMVPPHMLDHIAEHGTGRVAENARLALSIDQEQRELRRRGGDRGGGDERRDRTDARRTVYDTNHTRDLPGEVARREDAPATDDKAVDEAYFGLGATWRLFHEVYGRESLDDDRLPLRATVHYARDYNNAMWNGAQMVFGDGDGELFRRFTISIDIIGHELAHGRHAVHRRARIPEPVRCAERVDVGRLRLTGQATALASGRRRSRLADRPRAVHRPGRGRRAALDERAGHGVRRRRDRQGPAAGHMDNFVETTADNGGVHINSGIPNRAFYLAATAIGGRAWDGAGHVWYDVLTGGNVPVDCDFATFARLTVEAATARFGDGSSQHTAVAQAWDKVGVTL